MRGHPGLAALGQSTKSLRSTPLRGSKSREAGSQLSYAPVFRPTLVDETNMVSWVVAGTEVDCRHGVLSPQLSWIGGTSSTLDCANDLSRSGARVIEFVKEIPHAGGPPEGAFLIGATTGPQRHSGAW